MCQALCMLFNSPTTKKRGKLESLFKRLKKSRFRALTCLRPKAVMGENLTQNVVSPRPASDSLTLNVQTTGKVMSRTPLSFIYHTF